MIIVLMKNPVDLPAPNRARRQFSRALLGAGLGCLPLAAWSQAKFLSALSITDATSSVKELLGRGAESALNSLGQTNGFLGNPLVRIQLPVQLQQAANLMRQFGMGAQVDEVEVAMNRAAEQAVPAGKSVLVNAIQNMSVNDAKSILTGGDTAVTAFFASRTRNDLTQRFTPIVTQATERVALAQKFNQMTAQAARYGVQQTPNASLASYVTKQTVDGLYVVIAQQERRLREDPVGAGSPLLTRVLGGLQ